MTDQRESHRARTRDGVADAARAFLETLPAAQRDRARLSYTARHAQRWSNFPQGFLGREGRYGLRTGELGPTQWDALLRMLAAACGGAASPGYRDVLDHLDADDALAARGAGSRYGRGEFFVAILGEPDGVESWELQFGGHHLAISNTYANGELIGATPSFRGIEPFPSVEHDGRRVAPELALQSSCAALVAGLDHNIRTAAGIGRSMPDILLGPGDDWVFPGRPRGVGASRLTPSDRVRVMDVVANFVDRLPADDARRILSGYRAELDETWVAVAGGKAMRHPGDYLRIDGPSVWIEFSMHDGIVTDDPHPHAVWRDRRRDYGGGFRPATQ